MAGTADSSLAAEAARRDQTRALVVFALLAFVFVLYAPSLGNEFVWDDHDAAIGNGGGRRNPLVDELRPFSDYLLGNWWPQRNPGCQTYRPLVTFMFALRHAVVGDDARVAHLLNVLAHTLATGLSLLLLLRVGAGFWAAVLGALVFGVHAIHTESVLNIVGYAELQAFAAGVGATLCLMAARPELRRRWWLHYPAAFALVTVAYFSKESSLAWLGFAPMCVAAARRVRGQPQRANRADWLATAVVLVVPAVVFLGLRARMIAHLPPVPVITSYLDNPLCFVPATTRVLSGLAAWGYGLLLTLLPFRLQVDYGPSQLPIVTGLGDPWIVAALAATAALGWLAAQVFRSARPRPLVALAAAAFLGFSFITSNVPVPTFMMFAERVYFTPSLACALAVAWLVDRTRTLPRAWPATLLLVGVWVGASAHVAWQRNDFWRDDETIIRRGVDDSPASVRMRLCAGTAAKRNGALQDARRHFEAAAMLDPGAPEPWLELGWLAVRANELDQVPDLVARARQGRPVDVARCERELQSLAAKLAPAATPR